MSRNAVDYRCPTDACDLKLVPGTFALYACPECGVVWNAHREELYPVEPPK